MHFLYRAPLLQFDIGNSQEIVQHWKDILQCIELSSRDLYQSICQKSPEALTSKEWRSVYRYLLRGKYRATPFGKWAGVGIAHWGKEDYSKRQFLSYRSIDTPAISQEKICHYWTNPSLERWGGGWKFWNFDQLSGKWRFSKVEDSPFLQRIREISLDHRPIERSAFFNTFPDLQLQERMEVWNYLTESQLLLPERLLCNWTAPQKKEDVYISTSLSVAEIHRQRLDTFLDEIKQTAMGQKRPYQVRLARKFIEFFDDRFVPLSLLWKLVPYLNDAGAPSPIGAVDYSEYPLIMHTKDESIDLKTFPSRSGETKKPLHGQVLFRILESGKLLIDNLSFNRPFVYGGRFTFEPQIFEYFRQQVRKTDSSIQADVLLQEGRKTRAISAHHNLFDHVINCFSGSTSPNEFDCEQIYIGMNEQRFELVIPHLGKKLQPIFQHPLNPEYITHPLCRILWEVAHQDILRPIHYAHPGFHNASYLPQLTWGDIILQPRKWKIGYDWKGKTEEDLSTYLRSKNIPQRILVGRQDQELILNLSQSRDRQVLLQEISNKKTVNVFECLWAGNENCSTIPSIYPQFLWGKSWQTVNHENTPIYINLVNGQENKNWVSVRIVLRPDYQQHLVADRLFGLVSELEAQDILPFYFLYYPISNPEIRFRVKVKDNSAYEYVSAKLYTFFQNFAEFEFVRPHAYYPETGKYSLEGMGISEEMFYQESKLILESSPTSEFEKVSLAVGLGNLLVGASRFPEYWLEFFGQLCKGKSYHSKPDSFLEEFNKMSHKRWQKHYTNQIKLHPWINSEKNQGVLLGNHIHMAINRIFWENAADKEQEVHAILLSILRRQKFGKEKKDKFNL
ncbi:thiopeptide-type bacteriocin biosynthesis protein [Algoriphagus halophytocola]|uniref:thiopeptide-type bacteriocin biosynthesis protein n=1 Tax=Algoriphagus halophytocola TaxID=2991499 RepID=UPI0022DCE5D1|nr:thiopeptide-type bacteriocin biosynthesis protein [Algoriphagus sp. TR-M9]WBL44276.1 thiopeptide-type bacteriocin biosynthesis protein [Algoriphagus sp. TR-M9]